MRVKKKMTGLTMAVLLSLGQGGHAAEVETEPLMNCRHGDTDGT